MTVNEFADAVVKMREAQRKWLSAHSILASRDSLTEEKEAWEKKVDKALIERRKRLEEELKQQQGTLL